MLEVDQNQGGFTLVELILAMAMFSFGLLVIVAGFLAILGFYQHGTATRVVQNAARIGINEIVLSGRTAQWFAYNTSTVCVSGSRSKVFYVYVSGSTRQLREAPWISSSACVAPVPPTSGILVTSSDVQTVDLLPEQIDLFASGPATTPCTAVLAGSAAGCPHLTSLRVTLKITSDYTHLDPALTSCTPTAGPFCTISTLSTTMSAGEQ